VSFQGQAWELYNLARDRTELNDLAASEPTRLNAMVQMWNDMTKNVLHASAKVSSPVTEAVLPHRHREWTDFELKSPSELGGSMKRVSRKAAAEATSGKAALRARKNTEIKTVGSEFQLKFTGDDPGIAIDFRGTKIANGPYRLNFKLLSKSSVPSEVIYTVDPAVSLPKGTRVPFPVTGSDAWQAVSVELSTQESLKQLRIDIGDGPGEAQIADLRLMDGVGTIVMEWPQK
jgi:arylsulfatase